jgi:hypothetical protein
MLCAIAAIATCPLVCFLNNTRYLAFAFLFALANPSFALTRVTISADEISSSNFSAKKVTAALRFADPASEFNAKIGEILNNGRRMTDTELSCGRLLLTAAGIECRQGMLKESGELMPLTFRVNDGETFSVALQPKGERWQIDSRRSNNDVVTTINMQDGALARFGPLFPTTLPKLTKGALTGHIELVTTDTDNAKLKGRLALKEVDFSDAAGLRAAEKLGAVMDFDAQRSGQRWRFKVDMDWPDGELLWTPVYLAKSRKQLNLAGSWDPTFIQIDSGEVELSPIGRATFSGRWKNNPGTLTDLKLTGKGLDLDPLYTTLAKPFLESTNLNALNASGKADVAISIVGEKIERAELKLANANFVDANNRFSIQNLRTDLPWVNAGAGEGVIAFDSASFGELPIGRVNAKVRFNGDSFVLPTLTVPVLDGAIAIKNIKARRDGKDWVGEFEGEVTPISLPKLTTALKWPTMAGSLEGVIPRVRFDGKSIYMDGALQFKVFDGIMVATNMQLTDALGAAPQLEGTLVMSNLDLDTLTKTFSFGKMQGRIDMALENMLLSNWKPIRFDGRVMSSDGKYPRKISQQAVQNISSLGGAGAAAAIQRSFLRIFETFGYKKIGLTCKLRNTVCEMGGVENTPQGYVLVQGGGIPSITVMGYNRQVGWEELLARIKAATQSNAGPVVK